MDGPPKMRNVFLDIAMESVFRIMGGTLKTILMSLLLLVLGASQAWAGGASPRMLKQDIARFTALGAVYRPGGFVETKAQETPYEDFRRVETARLVGRVVYSLRGRIRIWKQLYCGNLDVIFLELSLRDAAGRRFPFAWQDCSIICDHGGACGRKNPLYVDLDGDGRAEARFPDLDSISTSATGAGWVVRRTFTKDIIPSWVKAAVGPDYKNIHPAGPDEEVPFSEDHPVSLGARSRFINE